MLLLELIRAAENYSVAACLGSKKKNGAKNMKYKQIFLRSAEQM